MRAVPDRYRARILPDGFSLVELLVAMTLGLLLLSGTIAVFAGNKRSSDVNSAMANLQENARFALEAMAKDARMAGFQGCIDVNKGTINTVAENPPTTDLRTTAARGAVVESATAWAPAIGGGFVPKAAMKAAPGTHALALQFGGPRVYRLDPTVGQMANSAGVPSAAAPITLDASATDLDIAQHDYVIVSNCDVGDLFRATQVVPSARRILHQAGANRNKSGALTLAYGDDRTIDQTMVMRFSSNVYFVADTGLENERGDTVRALYRQTLPYTVANPPTELIQGVENLRVAFGIRTPSGALRYAVPGAAGYDPEHVESIQIGVLMTSWDSITDSDDDRTYTLAGQPITAADDDATGPDTHPRDRRMRLAFNTTVRIRNRRNGT